MSGDVFSHNLKLFRESRGLSLSELARRTDISKGYLSHLENGDSANPSADHVYRLARALGTTMQALMGVPDYGGLTYEARVGRAVLHAISDVMTDEDGA